MFFEIRNGCGFQGALLKMASDSEGLRLRNAQRFQNFQQCVENGFRFGRVTTKYFCADNLHALPC